MIRLERLKIRVGWLLLAVLGLAIVTESNARLTGLAWFGQVSQHGQFMLFVLSLIALMLAGAESTPRPYIDKREAVTVLGLTLLALAVRLWRLPSSLPMFIDEVLFSNGILRFLLLDDVPLLEHIAGNVAPFTSLYTYLQAASVDAFGRDFVGLRMVSVWVGTASIPAVYLLSKQLFSGRVAILAALLLATFPPHVHFSRLALNNITDGLWGVLACGWLLRAFRTQSSADYIGAGIALGMVQYFHESGRLLFVPLLLVWIVHAALLWRVDAFNGYGVGVMLGSAVLVSAPVMVFLQARGYPLSMRFAASGSQTGWLDKIQSGELLDNTWAAIDYTLLHPSDEWYYRGDTPLLLWVCLPFFLVGMARALMAWRNPAVLLVMWFAAVMLGNGLLVESQFSPRFVAVFPVLMIATAAGLDWVGERLRLPFGVVIAAGILLAGGQAVYYFDQHLPTFYDQAQEELAVQDGVLRARALPYGTQVHLVGYYYGEFYDDMLAFFVDGLTLDATTPLTQRYLDQLDADATHAFLVHQADDAALLLLGGHFGNLQITATDSPHIRNGFLLVVAESPTPP